MAVTPELVFGLIGTLTGTVSLAISWNTWRSDRALLKIEAFISGTQSIELPQWHFQLNATLKNHGRRLVKVRELGIILAENQWETIGGIRVKLGSSRIQPFAMHGQDLSLAEGDRRDFTIDPLDLTILARARQSCDRSLVVYAIDSLDKEYRAKVLIPDEESIESSEQPGES